MPVERCTEDGKSGHRWGKSGKCYTGKDSKQKALRQGRAILSSKGFAQEILDENGGKVEVARAALAKLLLESNFDISEKTEIIAEFNHLISEKTQT